jgi:hypothetical protein
MRRLWFAAAVALCAGALASCIKMSFVEIYNSSGRGISMKPRSQNDGVNPQYEWTPLRPGQHRKFYWEGFAEDLFISVGDCVYVYPHLARIHLVDKVDEVAVQVEPDLSIHLLSIGGGKAAPGQFIDDAMKPFPLKPASKVCWPKPS